MQKKKNNLIFDFLLHTLTPDKPVVSKVAPMAATMASFFEWLFGLFGTIG